MTAQQGETWSNLAKEVVSLARDKGVQLGTTESCTGGMVAAAITSVPGASEIFKGAIVSYSNAVKVKMLGVSREALQSEGAVSEIVALQMATGAQKALEVDIAVSITGIAGPGGGSCKKPVGTVWIGSSSLGESSATRYQFSGDRNHIRCAATEAALRMLLACVQE